MLLQKRELEMTLERKKLCFITEGIYAICFKMLSHVILLLFAAYSELFNWDFWNSPLKDHLASRLLTSLNWKFWFYRLALYIVDKLSKCPCWKKHCNQRIWSHAQCPSPIWDGQCPLYPFKLRVKLRAPLLIISIENGLSVVLQPFPIEQWSLMISLWK